MPSSKNYDQWAQLRTMTAFLKHHPQVAEAVAVAMLVLERVKFPIESFQDLTDSMGGPETAVEFGGRSLSAEIEPGPAILLSDRQRERPDREARRPREAAPSAEAAARRSACAGGRDGTCAFRSTAVALDRGAAPSDRPSRARGCRHRRREARDQSGVEPCGFYLRLSDQREHRERVVQRGRLQPGRRLVLDVHQQQQDFIVSARPLQCRRQHGLLGRDVGQPLPGAAAAPASVDVRELLVGLAVCSMVDAARGTPRVDYLGVLDDGHCTP